MPGEDHNRSPLFLALLQNIFAISTADMRSNEGHVDFVVSEYVQTVPTPERWT